MTGNRNQSIRTSVGSPGMPAKSQETQLTMTASLASRQKITQKFWCLCALLDVCMAMGRDRMPWQLPGQTTEEQLAPRYRWKGPGPRLCRPASGEQPSVLTITVEGPTSTVMPTLPKSTQESPLPRSGVPEMRTLLCPQSMPTHSAPSSPGRQAVMGVMYNIVETFWEPPEARWSCRQSVTAHLHITNFSCVCIPSKNWQS